MLLPDPCYYCGERASTIDHVVPQSMLNTLRLHGDPAIADILNQRQRIKTVPACRECNCLLGNRYFNTITERKTHLKKRLRQRYQRLLAMPPWSDSELATLSGRLRHFVMTAQVNKERLHQRLDY